MKTIFWFDDDPTRKPTAKNLESDIEYSVNFIDLKEQEVEKKLSWLFKQEEPSLILLDHSLTNAVSETFKTGSTMAAAIREKWPQCPIVCITGADFEYIDIRHRQAYELLIKFSEISEKHQQIKAVADGFQILNGHKIGAVEEIIALLNPPKEEIEKIKKILPKEIKENINDQSLKLEIYRWLQEPFFSRPGFLYDKLWSATLLGLNNSGFDKVKHVFNDALYTGIFQDSLNPRWWKSELISIISEKSDSYEVPWVLGRILLPEQHEFYSQCYASEEEFPEIVAQEDSTDDSNWYAMKMKHTLPHPKFEDMLFFEDMRIMNYDPNN